MFLVASYDFHVGSGEVQLQTRLHTGAQIDMSNPFNFHVLD